ncbi:MAG: ABC transporter-like protein [Acidimicrobiaceae bacterium]|jgi:putative ABC transport system ATP-binding protein|nr:MAG: ABC transporter-like protein [Acidimicrobiaceae bacterium]
MTGSAPDDTPVDGLAAAGPAPLLELVDVSRLYGSGDAAVAALSHVSLRVMPGDFLSIMGPSGSGKSTMLGLLGCLDVPTTGMILVGGHEVTAMNDDERSRVRGREIGFLFQQFHLIPHLDALGNVETALLYRGLRPKERRERSRAALDRVGLLHRHDHRPVQLSGGEQQRVALARALVTEPNILLGDEPTGALDSKNADNVMEIFASLQSPERAVVLVTHDPNVGDAAERRVRMRDGTIVAEERRSAA